VLRVEQLEDRALLSGFAFTALAETGQPAPGPEGGTFTFDFETGGLTNKGQVVFTADLSEGAGDIGEGVFLGGEGGLAQVIRVGEAAPGGGTFGGFGSFSPDTINNSGDAAFAFGHDPLTLPIGTNAGVYLFHHSSGNVTAVVAPGVTPAPGGGTFQGAGFHPNLNNGGDLVFTGFVPADIGPGASISMGAGIFLADKNGDLFDIARPGDPAPGGNTFDFAENPAINNRGDIAFGAHIAADPCIDILGQTLPVWIFCAESVYFRDGQTGAIQSIAHQGTAIPDSAGGGTFDYAYAPVLNSRGQILFDAGLAGTSVPVNGSTADSQAIFLWSDGRLISIARQGDAMPGGGHLVSAAFNPGMYDINSNGDVAFNALLDTGEEGVFLWSHGSLSLLAKTGTVIPGVGTIASLDQYGTGLPNGYVQINDPGQVAFAAVLTDGTVALLLATPTGQGAGGARADGQAALLPAQLPVGTAPDALLVSALQGAGVQTIADVSTPRAGADQPAPSHPGDLTVPDVNSLALPTLSAGVQETETSAPDNLFAALWASGLDDPLR
jgi:hypothetical protein